MVATQLSADKQETLTAHKNVKHLYQQIHKIVDSTSALKWYTQGLYDGGDQRVCQHIRAIRIIYRKVTEWIMHGSMKCTVRDKELPVEEIIEEVRFIAGKDSFHVGGLRETNGVRAVLDHAGHLAAFLYDRDLDESVQTYESLSEEARQVATIKLRRCLAELFERHPVDIREVGDALRLEERGVHAYLDGRVLPTMNAPDDRIVEHDDAHSENVLELDIDKKAVRWRGKRIELRSTQRCRLIAELGRLREEEGDEFLKGDALSARAQISPVDQMVRRLRESHPEIGALMESGSDGYRLRPGLRVSKRSL